jgi:hypothetical protein
LGTAAGAATTEEAKKMAESKVITLVFILMCG